MMVVGFFKTKRGHFHATPDGDEEVPLLALGAAEWLLGHEAQVHDEPSSFFETIPYDHVDGVVQSRPPQM